MAISSSLRTATSVVMGRSAIARREDGCAPREEPAIIPSRAPRPRSAAAPAASRVGGSRARCPARDRPRPELARRCAARDRRAAAGREIATRRAAPAADRRGSGAAPRLLRQLLAGGVDRDRHVQVRRRRVARAVAAGRSGAASTRAGRRRARRRVTPCSASSTTTASWYANRPSARRTTKSPTSRARSCACAPCSRSRNATRASPTRTRSARCARRAPIRRDAVAAGAGVDALAAGDRCGAVSSSRREHAHA